MPTMRHLITLAEAPRKRSVPLSADERAAQMAAQKVQQLEAAKAEAVKLKAYASKVATEIRTEIYNVAWDKDWVAEIRAGILAEWNKALAGAKEEFEYEREDNPNAVLQKPDFLEIVLDSFARWWNQKKDTIEWSHGQYQLEDYYDSHRKTEQSDDMSRLQGQVDMLRNIQYFGGFGSAAEMEHSLRYMSSFADDLRRNMNGGWSDMHGSVAASICTQGIPLIMVYCNTIAAIAA
jgi:hypothetical protein